MESQLNTKSMYQVSRATYHVLSESDTKLHGQNLDQTSVNIQFKFYWYPDTQNRNQTQLFFFDFRQREDEPFISKKQSNATIIQDKTKIATNGHKFNV